jgi:hypothetical protein
MVRARSRCPETVGTKGAGGNAYASRSGKESSLIPVAAWWAPPSGGAHFLLRHGNVNGANGGDSDGSVAVGLDRGNDRSDLETLRLSWCIEQQTRVSRAQVLNGPVPGALSLLHAGGGTGCWSLRPAPGTPRIRPESQRSGNGHDLSRTIRYFNTALSHGAIVCWSGLTT